MKKSLLEHFLDLDVFAVLPTGFGKSACFQYLPLLFDKLLRDHIIPAIVVVVAPVTGINPPASMMPGLRTQHPAAALCQRPGAGWLVLQSPVVFSLTPQH